MSHAEHADTSSKYDFTKTREVLLDTSLLKLSFENALSLSEMRMFEMFFLRLRSVRFGIRCLKVGKPDEGSKESLPLRNF